MQVASQVNTPNNFAARVRHYADILNPLFWHDSFYEAGALFEYVCTLVRAGGIQDEGWDAYVESQAMLDDLRRLGEVKLPSEIFADVGRTRIRLALISYCHATEMDLPYLLLANLLRVRLGQKYDMSPFRDFEKPVRKKGLFPKLKPPTPLQKIKRIKALAESAKLPEIGTALEEIYDNVIRNEIYHSDYVLHKDELRLLKDFRQSKKHAHLTQVVDYEELAEVVANTFAFYSALLSLYERARTLLGDFQNAFLPFDSHYKGLLELVYEKEKLIGFRAYWPNGTLSEYTRTNKGSMGVNLSFNPDRSINFFVGLYASKPGPFSPLVEIDAKPVYAARPGTDIHPHWPSELKAYKLPA